MTQQDPSRLSGWLMFEMHCIAWNRNPKFPRNNHKKQHCHTCGYKSQLIKLYNFCTNKFVRVTISCHKTHHAWDPGHCHCYALCHVMQESAVTNVCTPGQPVHDWGLSKRVTIPVCTAHSCSLHSAPRLLSERGARCNVRGRRETLWCCEESMNSGNPGVSVRRKLPNFCWH